MAKDTAKDTATDAATSTAKHESRRASGGAAKVCVAPDSGRFESLREAVEDAGGTLVPIEEAEALIWADAANVAAMEEYLSQAPNLLWVQLPFAGIENFAHHLNPKYTWTCGKGVYARPVAEHALAMMLGGMRNIVGYARQTKWSRGVGINLFEANVTILGGGEITRELIKLLQPFDTQITVVRRQPEPIAGVARTLRRERLNEALIDADVVVLALALTPETEGIIGAEELALMPEHSWLVNVARGRHIDTDALVAALRENKIGGAALDVTEPEPLPEGHALWSLPNCLITPHTANTPAMGIPLLAERVRENVQRFASQQPLLGEVFLEWGY